MQKITPYLRELKQKSGLTQAQIAEKADLPEGTIPKYFAGIDDESASYEIVRKLVTVLNGSLDELAGLKRTAVLPAVQDTRTAFDMAIRTIEESHQRAYAKLHEESVNVVRDKNRWLQNMFTYCCILTIAVVALAVMVGVVR